MRPALNLWRLALLSILVLLSVPLWSISAWAQTGTDVPLPRDLVTQGEAVLPSLPADFQTLDHDWMRFEFPSSVRSRVEPLVRVADDFRGRLAAQLGHPVLLNRTLVRIARTPSQMAELAPMGLPPPPYAEGVAYSASHLAVVSLLAPGTWEASNLVEVMLHELTHLALAEATDGHSVPRWFHEGLAIRESGELPWQRRMSLMDAAAAHRLLPLSELERGFPEDAGGVALAYAESADFVQFLMRDSDRVRFE